MSKRIPEHYPILIVDDHPANRRVLGFLLDSLGLEHEEAGDGEHAVELAKDNTYGAILMDLMMPGIDGYEAARRIRTAEFATGGHTPIIAVTAVDLTEAREMCAECGMNDFVLKPISKDVLRDRLERWLQYPVAKLLAEYKGVLEEAASNAGPINRAKLRMLYGTDQLGETMEIFITATEALLIELQVDINEQKADEVRRVAHELKGSALSISAEQLAVLARDLQEAATAGNWQLALSIYADMAKSFRSLREVFVTEGTSKK